MFMDKFLGYGAKNLSKTELACGAFDMGSAGNSTLRGTSPLETETWIPAFAEERHSHYREMLVRSTPRIEQKGSGGNDRNERE